RRATACSQPASCAGWAIVSARRTRTRNVAWKASSTSAASRSQRRHTPRTSGPWRRTSAAKASASRRGGGDGRRRAGAGPPARRRGGHTATIASSGPLPDSGRKSVGAFATFSTYPTPCENDTIESMLRRHPAGLYVLFLTEMWERFGFYTMSALFALYMEDQNN